MLFPVSYWRKEQAHRDEREARGEAEYSRGQKCNFKHLDDQDREKTQRTADGPAQRSLNEKRGREGETRQKKGRRLVHSVAENKVQKCSHHQDK